MRVPARHGRRSIVVATAAVAVLAGGSTAGLAAASGAFNRTASIGAKACVTSVLPGAVVDLTLFDMSGMMGGGQPGWRYWPAAIMRATATPTTVQHGTVSLQVANRGFLTHELIVLPLAVNETVGTRAVGSGGRVDETGILGEASRGCAAGAGAGIITGLTGWTTFTLSGGRYELLCNLPGHYAAGMFTELDVT